MRSFPKQQVLNMTKFNVFKIIFQKPYNIRKKMEKHKIVKRYDKFIANN